MAGVEVASLRAFGIARRGVLRQFSRAPSSINIAFLTNSTIYCFVRGNDGTNGRDSRDR